VPKKKAKLPLSKTHPKLAKEAYGWDPKTITFGVGKKLSWSCKKGHVWEASPNTRSREKGGGCPYCLGRIPIVGLNDLKTTHPNVARKAHGWDPKQFSAGSGKRVNWKCKKGHEWTGFIYAEVNRDTDCSFCSGLKFNQGVNDLETTYPNIAAESFGWNPKDKRASSNERVNWRCKSGHIWKAQISNRCTRGDGCPICSNRVVEVGFNDLATTFPELAKQANGWDPKTVTAGNGKKASWKCNQGHIWEASILNRSKGNDCPICSNRVVEVGFNDLATTFPELAKQANGWDPKTVTAGNGKKASWKCNQGHIWEASIRNRSRKSYGCPVCSGRKVLRGFNDLKTKYPKIAIEAMGWNPELVSPGDNRKYLWQCKNGHTWKVSVTARTAKGSGCLVCANINIVFGVNDLTTLYPMVASQAFGWDPREFGAGSEKLMNWKCEFGHVYKSKIYESAMRGFGCRVCSGRQVLQGFNDLATKYPDVATEADGWDPFQFSFGSAAKQTWKCKEGHTWRTSIVLRTRSGTGCPSCAKFGFNQNEEAWLYFLDHPAWKMFQIGITNFPNDRLSSHKKLGWELKEIRGPMDGNLTKDWETSILRMLKAKGADLANSEIAGKFDGFSEAWSKSTFPVKSIKELMRLTEEFEERK
jgi:hypothetical protein